MLPSLFIISQMAAAGLNPASRARSMLAIYGLKSGGSDQARMMSVMAKCLDLLVERPEIEKEISRFDEFEEVVQRIGPNHRSWLEVVWKNQRVEQEPILSSDGEILAEPLFWFKDDDRTFACFGAEHPGKRTQYRLEDAGITIIEPGGEIS